MKSIENKETEIINVDEEGKHIGKCLYSHLINRCLMQPKVGNLDYVDIENRIAISKAVKASNGTIELEDSYFKYLKTLVENTKWKIFHEDILRFKEDVLNTK